MRGTLGVRAVFDMPSPLTDQVKAELFHSHRPAEGWIVLRTARPAGLHPTQTTASPHSQPGPVTYICQLFTSFLSQSPISATEQKLVIAKL